MTEQTLRHPWYTFKPREPSLLTRDIAWLADYKPLKAERVRADVFPPFPPFPPKES